MSPKRIKGLREGETEEEEERTWKGGERRGAWKRAENKKRRNQEEGEESQRTARSRGAPPSLLRGHLLPGEGVAPLPQAWGLLCFSCFCFHRRYTGSSSNETSRLPLPLGCP